jgi:hypothetical protein
MTADAEEADSLSANSLICFFRIVADPRTLAGDMAVGDRELLARTQITRPES